MNVFFTINRDRHIGALPIRCISLFHKLYVLHEGLPQDIMTPYYHTNKHQSAGNPLHPFPAKLIANARTMNNELKILLDGGTDAKQA